MYEYVHVLFILLLAEFLILCEPKKLYCRETLARHSLNGCSLHSLKLQPNHGLTFYDTLKHEMINA